MRFLDLLGVRDASSGPPSDPVGRAIVLAFARFYDTWNVITSPICSFDMLGFSDDFSRKSRAATNSNKSP